MNEFLRVLESQKDLLALNSSPAFRFCSHCSDRHDENANTVPDEAVRALDAIVSYVRDHEHAFYGRRRIPPPEGWMGFWPDAQRSKTHHPGRIHRRTGRVCGFGSGGEGYCQVDA